MADIKINDLSNYADPVSNDVLPIVDIGNDLTKKVSIANLVKNAGVGSATAPSISFDGDSDTGIYQPGANKIAIATQGTERVLISNNDTLTSSCNVTAGTYNTLTVGRGGGDVAGNTAVGTTAMNANTTGTNNAAHGFQSLYSNTTGSYNTGIGYQALRDNTEGELNTAIGRIALRENTTGTYNTAIGADSLRNNITGDKNTVVGYRSGYYIEGSNNTILGSYLGSSGDSSLNSTVIISAGATERARCNSSGDWLIGGNIVIDDPFDATSTTTSGITCYNSGQIYSQVVGSSSAGVEFLRGYKGSTQTISIKANGSADFAGNILSGGDPFNGGNDGVKLSSAGLVQASRPGSSTVWNGYQTGTSTPTSKISADGTAEFTGDIKINGGISPGSTTSSGLVCYDSGQIYAQVVGSAASTVEFFRGYKGTTQTIKIQADGGAVFTGTVTATVVPPSDARFKENITLARPQLGDIVALGGLLRNYDWNDDAPVNEELHSQRQLGLIAQEVAKVCPGLVKTIARTKQGAELTPEVTIPAVYETKTVPAVLDPNGEILEAETTEQVLVTEEQVTLATYEELDDSYKGLCQDVLVMKLLGAVAELTARVEELESSS